MKKCPKCKAQMSGHKFCTICGTDIQKVDDVKCVKCGSFKYRSDTFCGECGNKN